MKKLILLSLVFIFSQISFAAEPIQNILDPGAIDRSVDPCDNFYQYSCGSWLKEFKLPADKSSYWRQGNALSDHVEESLNGILADLSKTKSSSSTALKLGDYYKTCMVDKDAQQNSEALNELKKRIASLDHLKDRTSQAKAFAEIDLIGGHGLFEFSSDQDLKDSSQTIGSIDRGGMSLPDPDYYLKDDAKSKEIREHYKTHIANMFKLLGESADQAVQIGQMILSFETELAKHAMNKDDLRDTSKRFHPMNFAGLKALAPNIDWQQFVDSLGMKAPAKLNVLEPEFMKNLSSLLTSIKAEDLSNILKYKLMHRSAYYLSGPLQEEDFKFWRQYLDGQNELPPRWKYCTQIIASEMSEALGEAYVASIPNAKDVRDRTIIIFQNIKKAFAADLKKLAWMDAQTRKEAQKKLSKLGSKIGYPDHWRDYSNLKMNDHSFFQNELHATEFEVRRDLAKIDKPTDRTEWQIAVWEANAYYTSANNEMVLPLGETVPPVFDPTSSDAANYSSLGGSTIGHELTHGFDDSGKDMDADGNFVAWWTPLAKKKFEDFSQCFVKQTEAYDIIPGSKLRIRGKATLGENLADNGGIKLGLMALQSLPKRKTPRFEDYNEMQQYFISWAQGWCSKISDEKLRDNLLTNFHPPPEFRVNAVISNRPEFAKSFHCKAGSKMAPVNRCSLW